MNQARAKKRFWLFVFYQIAEKKIILYSPIPKYMYLCPQTNIEWNIDRDKKIEIRMST
jgi:hypothetical protein